MTANNRIRFSSDIMIKPAEIRDKVSYGAKYKPLADIEKPEGWFLNKPIYALRRNLANTVLLYINTRENKEVGPLGLKRAENMVTAYKEIVEVKIEDDDEKSPTAVIEILSQIIVNAAIQQNALSLTFNKDQYIYPSAPGLKTSTSLFGLFKFESTAQTALKNAAQLINLTRQAYGMTAIDIFSDIPLPVPSSPERNSGCSIM